MKIFISWSGKRSHKVAVLLHEWLKCVLNEVQPFVSSEDIRKGKRWLIEISKELQDSSFGIICLMRDNLNSPWILFEAGALSKFSDAHVSTLLLGELTPKEVEGPLSHFQATPFKKEQVKKLVSDINLLLKEKALNAEILDRVFEKWWPDLEKDVNLAIESQEIPEIVRSPDAILSEVLELSRFIAKNVGSAGRKLSNPTDVEGERALVKISDADSIISPNGDDFNHPVSVRIGPMPTDKDDTYNIIVVSHKGVHRQNTTRSIGERGVIVEIFFYCEQDYHWSLAFRFHKGETYGEARLVSKREAMVLGLDDQTIWRD